jgi:hypothetical protein
VRLADEEDDDDAPPPDDFLMVRFRVVAMGWHSFFSLKHRSQIPPAGRRMHFVLDRAQLTHDRP